MKRKCKHIDITDWKSIRIYVALCVFRHKKRHDFRKLLIKHGVTKQEYNQALKTMDYSSFLPAIDSIAREAAESIKNRKLDLPPVSIREKVDSTTGKIRMIGKESAMQQVYDHIAVEAAREIWDSRMVPQQMSSIPKRGQVKGMKLIRKYIRDDNRATRYAKAHGIRYTRKCRYHVKLDVHLCYPNADMDIFMELFRHDCGNPDVIWLWETLLRSHRVDGYTGFMIGALPSQWAAQFMLSFIYRKAMELYYVRRGKRHKKISHMVMFMDDMQLFGSSRKQLMSAVRELISYARDTLGFEIKTNFAIHDIDITPINMMGFVIYGNGKVEMRERNYIKSRRIVMRYEAEGKLVYSQAQRLNSYKGFYKYSDSRKATMEMNLKEVFDYCSKVISYQDKKRKEKQNESNQSILFGRAGSDPVHAEI